MRRPRKSFIWLEKMITAIPLVNPTTTGCGMNLIAAAELGDAQYHEYHAGHDRSHDEPVDAVSLDDSVDDHDERSGRPADLDTRATECGDQESADDGRVKTAIGSQAAGDRECNRKRESHYADDHSRGEIGSELRSAVRLQRRD